eukprot:8058091-Ditylum_brightwellii.AAC.1
MSHKSIACVLVLSWTFLHREPGAGPFFIERLAIRIGMKGYCHHGGGMWSFLGWVRGRSELAAGSWQN